MKNGTVTDVTATGTPGGLGQHSPCWAVFVGPYLFTTNSPSHSISRLIARGRHIALVAPLAAQTGGAPLDPSTRAFMEPRFGADFGDVRIHVDPAAARSVQALAFTRGRDIVFGGNQYAPNAADGRRLARIARL